MAGGLYGEGRAVPTAAVEARNVTTGLAYKATSVQEGQTVRLDIRLAWKANLIFPVSGSATRRRWRTAVLLPWADAVTKERRANGGVGNPGNACLPRDIFLVSPFLYKVIQAPTVMAILWEGNAPGIVQIFLDGRSHPKDPFPSWMRHPVGRWEGDTLVVDTVGFNAVSWVRVFPHTEKLHVVQRYRRPDLAPSEEVQEYICNENEKDLPHLSGQVKT
jgi:hypothetical protein